MSSKSEDLFRKISSHFILGKVSLMALVGLFMVMWLYFSIYDDHPYIYVFGFYCVSCLIIGPIDVIFAYFLTILLPFSHLDPMQIWIGIPLSFLLPGTQLNVGIYFGAMLDGLRGALLAAIFLYLPCFLSVYGILPSWKNYRDRQGVQRLYQGIVCTTTGLTLAMVCSLLLRSC
jgi:chromate transporter